MTSTTEARNIVEKNTSRAKPVLLPLSEAAGLRLAADVCAIADIPAFPQSSMDGYAFAFADWQKSEKLLISEEIPAGDTQAHVLAEGKTARIFTGAPVPKGADTVVMQEKVVIEEDEFGNRYMTIEGKGSSAGENVRKQGSEIARGAIALKAGTLLTPAAVGFLANIGISAVDVFPNPSIAIIVTGRELVAPGHPLMHGQVYESNSFALLSVLKQLHFDHVKVFHVGDDLPALSSMLNDSIQKFDLVLLTGGISAGDYDFVLQACEACGVSKLFHRVSQRPGKPLYFGKRESKLVFGLPGNPSSVLTCFYEYVLPALSAFTGRELALKSVRATLANTLAKTVKLTCFLKGRYEHNEVTVLDAQESYKMNSFATANCLVKVDAEVFNVDKGESVEIHLLPG